MPSVTELYVPTSKSDPIRCYVELPAGELEFPEKGSAASDTQAVIQADSEVGYDGSGWYFFDETWGYLHGPYNSYVECQAALRGYCDSM